MRISPFRATFPEMDYITDPFSFFSTVKEEYSDYKSSGFFKKTKGDAFYLYRIHRKGNEHTGIITNINIQDLIENKVKKHEATLGAKEQKQLQLLLKRKAAVKPILLTYPEVAAIEKVKNDLAKSLSPFFEVSFEEEQEQHVFWEITKKKDIQKLISLFETHVPYSFIADGHHRIAASLKAYTTHKNSSPNPYKHFFSALFPSSDIEVHEFNRIVAGPLDISPAALVTQLSHFFHIELLSKPQKPLQKHHITMVINGEWFNLTWKNKILQRYKHLPIVLDSMLLNDIVLKDILGIQNIRTDQRVTYVEGIIGLEGMRKKLDKQVSGIGFLLYPIQLEEILQLSLVNQVLPPKSTWFEPRMKNGLLVMEYE